MVPEIIHIPTPRMVTGNSKGEGDVKGQNFLKEGMKLNWDFQRAGGMAYCFFWSNTMN